MSKNTDAKLFAVFGGIALAMGMLLYGFFAYGYAIGLWWGWLVIPAFGGDPLTLQQGMAVYVVGVSLGRAACLVKKDDDCKWQVTVTAGLAMPWVLTLGCYVAARLIF